MRHTTLQILVLLIAALAFGPVAVSADEPPRAAEAPEHETGSDMFARFSEVLARLDEESLWQVVTRPKPTGYPSMAAAEPALRLEDREGASPESTLGSGLLTDSALVEQTWKLLGYLGQGMRIAAALDGTVAPDAEALSMQQEDSAGPAYSVRDRALRMVREKNGSTAR